jgi:hypothetical protein
MSTVRVENSQAFQLKISVMVIMTEFTDDVKTEYSN